MSRILCVLSIALAACGSSSTAPAEPPSDTTAAPDTGSPDQAQWAPDAPDDGHSAADTATAAETPLFDTLVQPPDATTDAPALDDSAPETSPDIGPDIAPDVQPDPPDTVGPDAGPCEVLALDAGDAAWAQRAIVFLLGRRPFGAAEVRAVAHFAGTLGRPTVALALARSPQAAAFWSEWVLDTARVNRDGTKANPTCFAPSDQGHDPIAVADVLRQAPADASLHTPFTMGDVLLAALEVDDLSLFFRANLFALLARPAQNCSNTGPEAMEAARRTEFGDHFAAVYTGRPVTCAPCHNSVWSVTDAPSPEDDRFWPAPGHLDEALFGAPGGAPEEEANAVFRFRGVASRDILLDSGEVWPGDVATPVAPWGMDEACGLFIPAVAVGPDPLGVEPHLAGAKGTIWGVEHQLRAGITQLAEAGRSWEAQDPVTGEGALAYLLAVRVADQAWATAFGAPLTLGHGSSRNPSQQTTLVALADDLSKTWSLSQLLVAISTHPWFNPRPPSERCSTAAAYELPPVFDPYSVDSANPTQRPNSAGDLARRATGTWLVNATEAALDWTPSDPFDTTSSGNVLLRAAGAFVSDFEPGSNRLSLQSLLAWEAATADCVDPQGSGEPDWIDALIAAALTGGPFELGDLVRALEDHLVVEPVFSADGIAAEAVAALFDQATLEVGVLQVGGPRVRAGTRRLCGVLLGGPHMTLHGPVPSGVPDLPDLVVPGSEPEARCAAVADWLLAVGVASEDTAGCP